MRPSIVPRASIAGRALVAVVLQIKAVEFGELAVGLGNRAGGGVGQVLGDGAAQEMGGGFDALVGVLYGSK